MNEEKIIGYSILTWGVIGILITFSTLVNIPTITTTLIILWLISSLELLVAMVSIMVIDNN